MHRYAIGPTGAERRDAVGRILVREESWRELLGSTTRTVVYSYNTFGRLFTHTRYNCTCEGYTAGTCGTAVSSTVYAYDSFGNRTDLGVATSDDRVPTRPVSGTITYNAMGQPTTIGSGATGRTYAYDVLGRLASATVGTSSTVAMHYDPLGRIVDINPGTISTTTPQQRFVYRDGLHPSAWMRRTCGTCTWEIHYYVYGMSQQTPDLEYIDADSDGVIDGTRRFAYDERGSLRLIYRVTGGTQQTMQSIEYDAWGNVITRAGFSGEIFAPFGFAGGIMLPVVDLVHFGARDYDPAMGRWTTKDPIHFGGGDNLYAYCGNDPVNHVDPTGLDFVGGLIVGGAFGGGLDVGAGLSNWVAHGTYDASFGSFVALGIGAGLVGVLIFGGAAVTIGVGVVALAFVAGVVTGFLLDGLGLSIDASLRALWRDLGAALHESDACQSGLDGGAEGCGMCR